jgi:glycosyltransferase involved in cell wall biosynthesis
MKILIATGIYPPDIGGPATYSKLLFEEFPKHDIDVQVISFGQVRYLPKIIRHLAYFLKVLKSCKSADVIYAQDPVSVGLPAVLAAKLLRKKFILKVVGDYAWEQYQQEEGVHFVTPEEFQNGKYSVVTQTRKWIERTVARKADNIVVPSNYLKKIVTMWGVKESKIKVIYNAFTPKAEMELKTQLREEFGFEGDIIFSAGRLVPWKGFELLIDIMKDLPDVKLFIVGDGPEKQKLNKKIEDLHLGSRVKLIGRLEQDELLKRIKAADLFVLNTGYEGLSHQLLEVMSVGTPIITTNVGGNPEVIESGKEGVLVDYNDKNALKSAIKDILKNGKGEEYAKEAVKKLSLFEKERMIEETINVLKNV